MLSAECPARRASIPAAAAQGLRMRTRVAAMHHASRWGVGARLSVRSGAATLIGRRAGQAPPPGAGAERACFSGLWRCRGAGPSSAANIRCRSAE
jgi:hypothetical protein